MSAHREPLPVECLLPADARRVTVEDHQAFRDSIARPCDKFDEIDHAAADAERLAELREVERNHRQ